MQTQSWTRICIATQHGLSHIVSGEVRGAGDIYLANISYSSLKLKFDLGGRGFIAILCKISKIAAIKFRKRKKATQMDISLIWSAWDREVILARAVATEADSGLVYVHKILIQSLKLLEHLQQYWL
ncbi:hypothetical protein ACET3Z_002405 [Daucus carota]